MRVWCRCAEGVPARDARASKLRLSVSDADGRTERTDLRRRRRQRASNARRPRLSTRCQPGLSVTTIK